MKLTMIVGDNIRGFRNKRGWTQARLGAECGTSGNYIGEIERMETHLTVEKLSKISKALKLKPHVFLIEAAYHKTKEELQEALSAVL